MVKFIKLTAISSKEVLYLNIRHIVGFQEHTYEVTHNKFEPASKIGSHISTKGGGWTYVIETVEEIFNLIDKYYGKHDR